MKKIILVTLLIGATYYFYSRKSSQNLEESLEVQNSKVLKNKDNALINRRLKIPSKVKSHFSEEKIIAKNHEQVKDERYWNFQDPNGDLYITSVFKSGQDIISHGDIIVITVEEAENLDPGNPIITLKSPSLWPDGLIPFKINVKGKLARNVKRAMETIEKSTGIRFRLRKNEKNYVEFTYGKENCNSNLGMIGGRQKITLTNPCNTTAILHEMMHTLGFMHEQNREDRDNYLMILWENILVGHEVQFKIIPHQFIDYSNFEFDMNSIMLYAGNSFTNSSEEYTILTSSGDAYEHNPTGLSMEDIGRIREVYNMAKDNTK